MLLEGPTSVVVIFWMSPSIKARSLPRSCLRHKAILTSLPVGTRPLRRSVAEKVGPILW
jgi:hypothetical protein